MNKYKEDRVLIITPKRKNYIVIFRIKITLDLVPLNFQLGMCLKETNTKMENKRQNIHTENTYTSKRIKTHFPKITVHVKPNSMMDSA